ncbi:MAG: Low conductance mechanosensitive channel YnaI [bacterium ADurb.Bin429]|nr:MAG: Low conductance mechanosensitive channel YnaI [bacterium ADurb.Bin429]
MEPSQEPLNTAQVAGEAVGWLRRTGLHLSPLAEDVLTAVFIALGFLVLALIARLLMQTVLRRITRATNTTLDDDILQALGTPLVTAIVITGVMIALISLDALSGAAALIMRLYSATMVLVFIVAVLRILTQFIGWRSKQLAARVSEATAAHYGGLWRKVMAVVIWVVGGMVALEQLGVEITPLLTTLGLGSLAVALALQDTLANFFAGIYLMLDRPIKVGDYVRLDTGDEGFVDAIGWRSTHIRLWSNYIVVLPNARLTSSVITNMVLSQSETSVYINGGVSYLSDLDEVERVLMETGREVLARVEGGVPEVEPLVRFQEFGDSNITFLVILKVQDFSYQYVMKHEYIKAVFRRFKEAGIEISWPVRQLVAPHPISVVLAPESVVSGKHG